MAASPNIKNEIVKISENYFNYMAKEYPVMCLSDEFYFFPRARKSIQFLNCLDSLDKQKIIENVSYIKNLKNSLEKLPLKNIDLDTQIDLTLLNQSMSTFLREFGEIKIWQSDPTIYLKIIIMGIEQLITNLSFIRTDTYDNLSSRITQIPPLLNIATDNLKKMPLPYLETALEMVKSFIDYFKCSLPLRNKYLCKNISPLIKKVLCSLMDFKKNLLRKQKQKLSFKNQMLLERILKESFSYKKGIKEIFDIATEEYHSTIKQLNQLAKKIDSTKNWQEILLKYKLNIKSEGELLRLYSAEIKKVKEFLEEKNILPIPKTQNILVKTTPKFMEPIRASASYSSSITNDMREQAHFYITSNIPKDNKLSKIHNEYVFITAHETYPGHHLLDSIRKNLKNPVRQQIESPLFYEGWSSYAERLIDELGYIKNPIQRLVGLKRQAWRAVRAMVDIGVRTGELKFTEARELLKELGYEPSLIKSMLRHYLLTPGYQLCYTIGKYEIEKLKKQYSSKLGLKEFYNCLLTGGEIPFNLIERRLKDKLCQKNS
jgi:hypothetical protein